MGNCNEKHSKKLTREKVVKVGKITATIRSNDPSEKAIKDFNEYINRKAIEYFSE